MTYQVPSAVQADRRGEWKDYDPDRDDYDPCTAVLLPPPADANELFRRQDRSRAGGHGNGRRIRKGGKEKVLAHYLKVVEEMERSMNPDTKEVMVVTQFKKEFEAFSGAAHVEGIAGGFREASEFCHKRTTSAASTAAPEGPEQVDDLEEDHEDEEELGWSRAVTSWDDTKGERPARARDVASHPSLHMLLRWLLLQPLAVAVARVLLFWPVDDSERTQRLIKANVRHAEEINGVPGAKD
eukprot:g654.t1